MPHNIASARFNYVRYGLHYLGTMQRVLPEVPQCSMRGGHITRHKLGLWNEIWSDMWIKTTCMRHGHGPNEIIGITQKRGTLTRMTYFMHGFQDIENMSDCSGEREITSNSFSQSS